MFRIHPRHIRRAEGSSPDVNFERRKAMVFASRGRRRLLATLLGVLSGHGGTSTRQLPARYVLQPRLSLLGVLLALFSFSGIAQAAEPAVQFVGFAAFGTGNYSVGWSFTVNQPTEVS